MASTYRGYPGSAPVPPVAAEGSNDPIPLVAPPPPPSARRGTAPYAVPPQYGAEASGLPVDKFAETTPRDEDNPFQKPPSRFRRWLKRPSREVIRTSGIAVLGVALGWVVGAKPWKPKPVAHAAVAAKAPTRTASAARPQAPRRVAVMTHAAMPAPASALKPTVVSAKPSQPSKATQPVAKKVTKTTATATKKPNQVATKTQPAKAK